MKVKRKGNNGNNCINAGKINKISEYYYAEGKLIAMNYFKKPKVSGGWWPKHPNKGLNFYHKDALSSVTMTTGRNGQAVERYEYDAYGDPYNGWFEHSAHNQNPYGFTGQRYSNQLGTWNFAYRHYNSQSMRWMTVDPVKDGTNWYVYVNADPVNLVDPDGRSATGAFGTMWTVALAEPTPVGETIASVVTVGYGVYSIANSSQMQKAKGLDENEKHKMNKPLPESNLDNLRDVSDKENVNPGKTEDGTITGQGEEKGVKNLIDYVKKGGGSGNNNNDGPNLKEIAKKTVAIGTSTVVGITLGTKGCIKGQKELEKLNNKPDPQNHVTHPQMQQSQIKDESSSNK
ncbi:RHS repeat domain-containing protein [Halobacteroides halobius]|uniref:RHS repeat domain-containing protein n=1 Tax=Halobacteroides halobius TaxID=42422 RepID=UPI0002F0205A|nr:RHS repeat-associated core domain-containing protein [Halobacteroides halobius]